MEDTRNKYHSLTREEFRAIYERSNGFSPTTNPNHPERADKSFFQLLEEGADILYERYPKLAGSKKDLYSEV